MNQDFGELIEYLDEKFDGIDQRFVKIENDVETVKNDMEEIKSIMATKKDFNNILNAVDKYAKRADEINEKIN